MAPSLSLRVVGCGPSRLLFSKNAMRSLPSYSGTETRRRASSADAQEEISERERTQQGAQEILPMLAPVETVDMVFDSKKRAGLWKAAIKLPMYWVAVIPVLVGAAAAYHETGVLSIARTAQTLIGAICVLAWLNLSNDVFDHEAGADATKQESVVNLTGNAPFMFKLSLGFLAVGICTLAHVIFQQQTPSAVIRLGAAIACGYVYQAPPFRLSYKGLGELLCFVAFGPLATSAFYLLFSGVSSVTSTCWAASILVGIWTTLVLFCSHFHQFESDKAVGKMSPVVRMGGPHNALRVLQGSILGSFLLLAGLSMARLLPRLLMPLGIIPAFFGLRCAQYGTKHLMDLSKLRFLKLYALDVHATLGLALFLSLILTRALAMS